MTIELPNGCKIGPGEPCFIVAEIGQNHQGDAYTALRLIKAAHEAGVDAVKFCKRHIPSDLTAEAAAAPYDNPHSFGATYGEHREALELTVSDYRHLQERMAYNEWPEIFFATACDIQSAAVLETISNPPMYKIASRDIDNLPLIDFVAQFGKPVILSTGMATQQDIHWAVTTVRKYHEQIILLYCVSEYPTPIEHIDLQEMKHLSDTHGCVVGVSDHSAGIVVAQAAAVMGAVMVEKHLTLAREMKGTDHGASLEPDGMARLVRNIRIGEQLRGRISNRNFDDRSIVIHANRCKLGRSIVAVQNIQAGTTIDESMLTLKSPGTGVRWSRQGMIVGHEAARAIKADTLIMESDVLCVHTLEAAEYGVL